MRWLPLNNGNYDVPVRMDPRPMFPRSFHPVFSRELPDRSGSAPYVSRSKCAPTYYFSCLSWSQVGDVNLIKRPIAPPGPTLLSAVGISELAAADIIIASELLGGSDMVSEVSTMFADF